MSESYKEVTELDSFEKSAFIPIKLNGNFNPDDSGTLIRSETLKFVKKKPQFGCSIECQ